MVGLGVDVHPYYQRGASFTVGVDFAWIKMADGARPYAMRADGQTWTADEHARRLRADGVPFGGYVYAQPGDGGDEAQVLWNECLRLGGTGVAPACDIEDNEWIHIWSTREAIDHGRAFCSAMRKIGVRPAVYMNDSKAGACQPDSWPEDPVLWIARYGRAPQQTHYDVHQYTDAGALPGSASAVDWNQAYTTAHLLAAQPAPAKDDDMAVQGTKGTGQVSIPVNGGRQLFCLIGGDSDGKPNKVTGHLYWIRDTPPGTADAAYAGDRDVTFDKDRPGPVAIPEGVRGATFYFTATAPFTAWAA